MGIRVTDIAIEEAQELRDVGPVSRGRSRWKFFTSGLMALCQFRTSRTLSSPEPTIPEVNKTMPSGTKAGEIAEVGRDTKAAKSIELENNTKPTKSLGVGKGAPPQTTPEATTESQVDKSTKAAAFNPTTNDPPQLLDDIDTTNL